MARVICYGLVYDLYRNDPVKHCVPGLVNRTLATSGYPLEYLVSAYSLQQRDLWASENVRDYLADYCIRND